MQRFGQGTLERDARQMSALLTLAWATVEPDGSLQLRPVGNTVRMGGLGPALELRRIADTNADGTPKLDAGGEQQVRYGLFLRNSSGVDAVALLSGTAAQPDRAALLLLSDPPSSAADTGSKGEIRVDASYIYICTATNTWKRVGIATW